MTEVRRMGNALIVPLALIDPHPANVREHLGDLTELAESIRIKGVLQSVVVRPHGPRFQLITGHRRCAAARMVGKVEVPVIVRQEATDADVVEDMLHENMHRRQPAGRIARSVRGGAAGDRQQDDEHRRGLAACPRTPLGSRGAPRSGDGR